MDIQLPGVNGMEAAEILRGYDSQTPLIFVTNLAQYAVQGYAVDALDFLVKPVSYADFVPRMDRALRAMRRKATTTVALPSPEGTRLVAVGSITYVDMMHHDLHYHLEGETEPLRMRGSMKAAEDELAPHAFLRISSGCLVNMAQVKLVRQGSVVLGDGTELFFSRAKRKGCLEAFANYVGGSL
jgi:DNA-binding LytR/AlgR family response regulator